MPRSVDSIPQAVRAKIERMLQEGKNGKDIAKKLKIDPRIVSMVRQHNIKTEEARMMPQPELAGVVPAAPGALAPPSDSAPGYKRRDREKARLKEYRRHLQKHLPIAERAKVIGGLARKWNVAPFIAIRAVEQADRIDGFGQQIKEQGPQAPGPMFVIQGVGGAGAGEGLSPISVHQPVPEARRVAPGTEPEPVQAGEMEEGGDEE